MPKLIKNLGVYRCIDVRTKTAAANGGKPNWRSRYIDQIGTLSLYKSERKSPGTSFFSFRITFGIYAATSAASQMTAAPSSLQPKIAGIHLF